MKYKHISRQSAKLLSYFYEKGQVCFDYAEAIQALTNSTKGAIYELLSDMTTRGLLMRLREGIYYIIPYEQDADMFMPDWHLIVPYIVKDAQYYIGYYSAMQIHNLITQPSLKEQIVVSRQLRPSIITIRNIPFQYIYHNPTHFFGITEIWIDNFHKVRCSDLEKTIVDCLFKPNYAGGIVEIAKAIDQTKSQIKYDKLLEYAQKFRSQGIIKRLGFLLELLGIQNDIIKELQNSITPSYILLDPELPPSGKFIGRWSIRQNLDTETIQSAIYT